MKARDVRLEESATSPKHQGVVCSLKDNFGFIERADCVKEIFFHFSEFMGEVSNVNVGDDVEFEIHTRNVSYSLVRWDTFIFQAAVKRENWRNQPWNHNLCYMKPKMLVIENCNLWNPEKYSKPPISLMHLNKFDTKLGRSSLFIL